MRYTVESIEDNVARLEGDENETIYIDASLVPADAKEGDVLIFDGQSYVTDVRATEERRRTVYQKFNRLFRK